MNKFHKMLVIFLWLVFLVCLTLFIIGSPLIKSPEMLIFTFVFNLMNTGLALSDN